MISLKPCPFCGSTAVSVRGATAIYVVCLDCMAGTGCFDSKKEAVEAWNNRHPTEKEEKL